MIGYLEGILHHVDEDKCVLVVSGVGYEVLVHVKTRVALTPGGDQALYIHHHIREDGQLLFGFLTMRERDLFRILIQLQGVGPKLGLVILDQIAEDVMLRAVADKDVARFQSVKGVGARMAERLVIELKPKLAKWQPVMMPAGDTALQKDVVTEVLAALAQLGYTSGSVMDKVRQLCEPDITTEALLKKALQALSRV